MRGISAGLGARWLGPSVEPLIVIADAYPNVSICDIPYHMSGEVAGQRSLAHRTHDALRTTGLELLLDSRAAHRHGLAARPRDRRRRQRAAPAL